MAQYISKSVLVAEIEKYISNYKGILNKIDKSSDDWVEATSMSESKIDMLQHILSFLDTLEMKEVEEEPVSNDLEEAVKKYLTSLRKSHFEGYDIERAFKKGAQWQKEQTIYKACNYLFSHMGLFVTFFDDDIVEDIERSEFIKKFRKAMENKL